MEFRDLKKQYELNKEQIDKCVAEVISSAHFISGPQVKILEERLAKYVGVKHCITCANGTDAISLGLMAWNVGKGDAVFVPDFTFFSSGECPAFAGATPIFVDVKDDTYNIDPIRLEEAVKKVINDGKYNAKVVIAVDLFGQPAEYGKIKEICEKYNLLLLEDAAQGFGGGIIDGNNSIIRRACSFGDISTTSFFPAKPLGCYGDGGAVFTNNDEWAALIRSYAVHGKGGNDKYNNVRIGMNSRLDTLQAAVILAKLEIFANREIDEVNRVAKCYYNAFDNVREIFKEKGISASIASLTTPTVIDNYVSSWAQYTIQISEKVNRDELQNFLKMKQIPSMVYYMKPMHMQGAFEGTDSALANCPVAERLCKTVLSLPMHPYMTKEDVSNVVEAVAEYICSYGDYKDE